VLRAIASLALLALAASLSVGPLAATAGASAPRFEASSSNWAGYALTGGPYLSIGGRWTVPTVTPAAGRSASAIWLGIDGTTNSSLIQVGTEQDSANGRVRYFAWWEILPAPAVRIATLDVRPGDRISAAISQAAPGRWRITIRDARSGTFSTVRSYRGPGSSAEWIEEAPFESGRLMPLAAVGPATFDLISANGTRPGLAVTSRITLRRGATLATPSMPDGDFDGFTVRRGAVAPIPTRS
jgi:hypothetical protein